MAARIAASWPQSLGSCIKGRGREVLKAVLVLVLGFSHDRVTEGAPRRPQVLCFITSSGSPAMVHSLLCLLSSLKGCRSEASTPGQ